MAKIKRKWCKDCQKYVGAIHQGRGLSFGLLDLALTLVTAGIWLLLWIVMAFLTTFLGVFDFRSKWVCPNCGRRV